MRSELAWEFCYRPKRRNGPEVIAGELRRSCAPQQQREQGQGGQEIEAYAKARAT